MKIGIAPEVFAAWPSYRRIVVVARDVDNAEEDPALEALLRRAEEAARQDPPNMGDGHVALILDVSAIAGAILANMHKAG